MGYAYYPDFQVHPGIWIMREIVEAYGLTVARCADLLCMEALQLQPLLDGRMRVSPAIALRLQNAFGIKAETLLAMQAEYDLMQQTFQREWNETGRRLAS